MLELAPAQFELALVAHDGFPGEELDLDAVAAGRELEGVTAGLARGRHFASRRIEVHGGYLAAGDRRRPVLAADVAGNRAHHHGRTRVGVEDGHARAAGAKREQKAQQRHREWSAVPSGAGDHATLLGDRVVVVDRDAAIARRRRRDGAARTAVAKVVADAGDGG